MGTNREAVRDRAKGYYANRTPEQIENDQRTRAAWYQKNKKKQRRVQKARQEARRGVYQPDDSVTTHTATEIAKVLNGVERSGFRNPRGFAAWRPDDQTKVLIGQINKVLAEYSEHLPLTRPEKLLIEELRRGNIEILTDEKAAAFIPMAYRFFEAAKEGEYEHNLRLLAEFLKSELEMEEPDPSSFARMARRVEGLLPDELKVIALIDAALTKLSTLSARAPTQTERPFVSAHHLANDPSNREKFDHLFLQEALNELAARGLLISDGASRMSKSEEFYFASTSFMELIDKARNTVKGSTGT